jgi:hypothetical protein
MNKRLGSDAPIGRLHSPFWRIVKFLWGTKMASPTARLVAASTFLRRAKRCPDWESRYLDCMVNMDCWSVFSAPPYW